MSRFFKSVVLSASLAALLSPHWHSAGQAAEHVVNVVTDHKNLKLYFEPKVLVIQPGDTVTWVNEKSEDHNMMTYPDGYPRGAEGFISPYLGQAGEKWSHTFNDAGTYHYHCMPHIMLGMRGTIIVGEETSIMDFNDPTAEETAVYRDFMMEFFDEDDIETMPEYVRKSLGYEDGALQ